MSVEITERGETPPTLGPLYAPRVAVYPKAIKGVFRRLKWVALVVLLGIYYAVPWLRWDRGPGHPDQAVLIDMPNGRAYFFFIEIWPQEIYFLAGLLILAALGLFLVTSLAGRVWCGYACPQTVWTDLYMWVERLIEGDRNARIKLDRAKLTWSKAFKKTLKHGIWIGIAALTGGAWVLYFNDAPSFVFGFFDGAAPAVAYIFFAGLTFTTYALAGWMREQVCTYMCPWPRIQAAMCDEDTLIVTYQDWRGEPRGAYKKNKTFGDTGHCVDCFACVNVCPTGIDIRDGQQLECIGCALCIDACNDIMGKLGLPKNLITYDTARRQDQRAAGSALTYRTLRLRTVLYAALIAALAGFMSYLLFTRAELGINVQHERNPLFVTLSDGSIQNAYTFKILNMQPAPVRYRLTVEDLENAQLQVLRQDADPTPSVELTAEADSVSTYRIFVRVPPGTLDHERSDIVFTLTALLSSDAYRETSIFRGP